MLSNGLTLSQIQSKQHSERNVRVLIRRGLLSVTSKQSVKRGIIKLPLDLSDDADAPQVMEDVRPACSHAPYFVVRTQLRSTKEVR